MKSLVQKILAVLTFGALLLTLVGLVAFRQINRLIADMGVQSLDYRIEKIRLSSAHFSDLAFHYTPDMTADTSAVSTSHQVNAADVRITWNWLGVFSPQLLSIDVAQLHWHTIQKDEISSATSGFALPEDWSIPGFLPDTIHVHRAQLTLPCPSGECFLTGKLDAQQTEEKLTLHGQFSPGAELRSQYIDVSVDYRLNKQLPALTLQVTAEDDLHAELTTQLHQAGALLWSGEINAQAHYPAPWLLEALADWHISLDRQWAQALNQPTTIRARWEVAVEPLVQHDTLPWHKLLHGEAELDMDMASPVAVQNIGTFSGKAALRINAKEGALQAYELSADVTVSEPVLPTAWQSLGIDMERVDIRLASRADAVSFSDLPVQLVIRTQGKFQANADVRASINAVDKSLLVPDVQLDAQLAQFHALPDVQISDVNLSWRGAAEWQDNQFALRAQAPSRVQGDLHANAWSFDARSTTLTLDNLAVSGVWDGDAVDWDNLHIDAAAQLNIAQLQHPQLHTKPWQWRGGLQGSMKNMTARGELTVNNSLVVSHAVKLNADELQADWQLHDSFLLAGNPFADVARAWPPLLSLTQGKVKGEGKVTFDLNKQSLKKGVATLMLNDISGIYDTILFQGLTTNLSLSAGPKVFTLATEALQVKQINKGFIFGPLRAAGMYEAGWENPTEGKLMVQDVYADVIGGSVTTPAQVFDLSKDKQSLVLTLDNIDLGLLLQQHPSSELSGSGRISGTVPIEITAKGVSVPNGVVAARPPGGQLQLHSERAEALAKSQPSMKLITDALEDFHYTVLASEVSYDEDGKLLLALRLEGRNPALENGRPVHFNINLEEDLPAMIASIQLSNQISDLVKKRLQEHLQKRSAR